MEVKSVSDCLNIIDIAIVRDIDMKRLEDVRQFFLDWGVAGCDDERDALWCVLKQINLIIDYLYKPFGEDQKMRYIELRKLVLLWVIEINSKLEDDNELKREKPNDHGHRLPKYIIK